jgi:O-antigen ligase
MIASALFAFGGVQPHASSAILILCLLGTAIFLATKTARNAVDRPSVIGVLFFGLIASFSSPQISLALFACVWAWLAARENGKKVVSYFHYLVVIGIAEALYGLIQRFFSPGSVLGYRGPYSSSSGTLINPNQFAGLLEMLIPAALGLAFVAATRHRDVARSYVYILAGAFMGLALVSSLSRAGILSFMLTTLFLALLIKVRLSGQWVAGGLGLGLLALVTVGALWVGIGVVLEQYQELLEQDALISEGRLFIYQDTLRLIANNPLGVGHGKFKDVFRQYQTFRPAALFDHAHNDYLESAADLGLPIAIVFWGVVLFILVNSTRSFLAGGLSMDLQGALLGCIGAIFSILVHSFVDFNLQIPSNCMLFMSFLGLAAALSQHSKHRVADNFA